MVTVAAVIERVARDYLYPPNEQPTRFTVGAGGISSGATTLPVSATLLAPEEQDLIGPGTIIEVVSASTGGELMLLETVTGDPPTSTTVRRAMYGTTAVAHIQGDFIYLAPEYPRQEILEAVADSIESLWPRLWTVGVEETAASGTDPTELPAECEEILEVRALDGRKWELAAGWELLTDFPYSATGKAIQFTAANNEPIIVKYRKAPIRPTAETDDLTTLGVETNWIKAVCVGAVAAVVSSREVDRATVEFITNILEEEGYPAGAGTDLRNSLLQYQDYLMRPLIHSLEARQRTQMVIDSVF